MDTSNLHCRVLEPAPGVWLHVMTDDRSVTRVGFGRIEGAASRHLLVREAAHQLEAYFRGDLRRFDLPLDLAGTPFQLRVWNALLAIPYGSTRTYADLAAEVGSPGAARAVGGANHANPIAIIVPCHRVVNAGGGLGGYAGGLELKRTLLELEGVSLAPFQPVLFPPETA